MQWTDGAEERMYSFCNVVNTVDGGTHVSGLRRALTRCLNAHAYETGRLKRDKGESLEARDVFDGLTAAVSVMVADPQFEGQTKGRLNNSEAQSAVSVVRLRGLRRLAGAPTRRRRSRSSTGCC